MQLILYITAVQYSCLLYQGHKITYGQKTGLIMNALLPMDNIMVIFDCECNGLLVLFAVRNGMWVRRLVP